MPRARTEKIKENKRKKEKKKKMLYRLTDMENRLRLPKGRGWSGVDGEFGVSRCKLLHLDWISNEVLLYSTGDYIQFLGIEHDGQ